MADDSWKTSVAAEMRNAYEARSKGNEGRARVCARRAAGDIAEEYLRRQGIQVESSSAIVRLKILRNLPELPSSLAETIDHFLIRITSEHKLPINADLLEDVYFLTEELLAEKLEN